MNIDLKVLSCFYLMLCNFLLTRERERETLLRSSSNSVMCSGDFSEE